MKVILLQDVARIGKRHTEVDVPDGYALNQLIPKRMALPATPQNRQKIGRLQAEKAATVVAGAEAFAAGVAAIRATELKVAAEANEQAHLFQAVHAADVVSAAAAAGITIDPQWVRFATPVKSLGEHTVTLAHGTAEAHITITVVAK
jgi:large subunit ribosomal protein L9